MESYQRWPFLPASMRSAEQNRQWWEHCFVATLPVEHFANAVGSTAVISTPGNGKTTALEYVARQAGKRAMVIRYPTQNWPHGPRPKVLKRGTSARLWPCWRHRWLIF